MTDREKKLVTVLQAGIAEAVTLVARLPDPYAANLSQWIASAKRAIKETT